MAKKVIKIILGYSLLLLGCFFYYYYSVYGNHCGIDCAPNREQLYLLIFTICPIIASVALLHLANYLPAQIRKTAIIAFAITWVISPFLLWSLLSLSSDTETMMGMLAAFIIATILGLIVATIAVCIHFLVIFINGVK